RPRAGAVLTEPPLVWIGEGVAVADHVAKPAQQSFAIGPIHLLKPTPTPTLPHKGEGVVPLLAQSRDDPRDQVDLDQGDEANSGCQDQAVSDGASEDLTLGAHPVDAGRANGEILRADHLAHHAARGIRSGCK